MLVLVCKWELTRGKEKDLGDLNIQAKSSSSLHQPAHPIEEAKPDCSASHSSLLPHLTWHDKPPLPHKNMPPRPTGQRSPGDPVPTHVTPSSLHQPTLPIEQAKPDCSPSHNQPPSSPYVRATFTTQNTPPRSTGQRLHPHPRDRQWHTLMCVCPINKSCSKIDMVLSVDM